MFPTATLLPIIVVTLSHPLSYLLKVGDCRFLESVFMVDLQPLFASTKGGFVKAGRSHFMKWLCCGTRGPVSPPDGLWVKGCVPDVGLFTWAFICAFIWVIGSLLVVHLCRVKYIKPH